MKNNRPFSLFLTLTLLLSSASLFSCTNETLEETAAPNPVSDDTTVDTDASETEPVDALEARKNVSDDLPAVTFDGATFAVIGDEKHIRFYEATEITGEPLNDAVFDRNQAVIERFDVNLMTDFHPEANLPTLVNTAVMSGDHSYQLVNGHVIYLGTSVLDGNMYDWNLLPHINFEKPWWSDSTVEDMSYKGHTLLAMGDYDVSALSYTYCMFFNKTLSEMNNLPNLYDLVNEGKWTIDKLAELTETTYVDTNGDGVKDETDAYGFATSANSTILNFQWAFDKKIVEPDSTGRLSLDGFYDEKYVDIANKLYAYLFQSQGVFTMDGWNIGRNLFSNGNTMIAAGSIRDAEVAFRDVDVDYGIIPYPKWNEAQEEYHTSVDGSFEVMAVLKGVQDAEFIGVIAEALNAETYKQVSPAYYDITIKTKGTRDPESVAMLDLIVNSRVFDFGFIYGGWGPAFWLNDLKQGAEKIASTYAANIKSITTEMEKVFTHFEEYTAK